MKTLNYVPITGTKVGKPITGRLEIEYTGGLS